MTRMINVGFKFQTNVPPVGVGYYLEVGRWKDMFSRLSVHGYYCVTVILF